MSDFAKGGIIPATGYATAEHGLLIAPGFREWVVCPHGHLTDLALPALRRLLR